VLGVIGILLLVLCAPSFVWGVFYQQPPGAWKPPAGTVAPGGTYSIPPGTPPPGNMRVRFICGSLIIANGSLRVSRPGMVTLGHSYTAGWKVLPAIWKGALAPSTWKFYFFREHLQINVFLVAIGLVLPWAIRRWIWRPFPKTACQTCGYDLRGNTGALCPECGREPSQPKPHHVDNKSIV
jgi:hypothetical protein